jgi:hypothetical protein
MRRQRIDGAPVARFTRRLSPKYWVVATAVENDSSGSRWRVELSPRVSSPTDYRLVQVQIEREDGRVEGVSAFTVMKPWTYARTVDLAPNESIPSLIVFEFVTQRLVWVRRRLRA